jgi:hypothetical protein
MKIVGMMVIDEIRNGIRYLSGLTHIIGVQRIKNMIKETKSAVVIVPPASDPLIDWKEGQIAVRSTRMHWPPYQELVAVHTNERKTLLMRGKYPPHIPHIDLI